MNKKEATENFERFLATVNSQSVVLVPNEKMPTNTNTIFTFEAQLKDDKYIKNGSSFNLSDEYFADLDKYGLLFMGQKPSLNNTGSNGWFIIKVDEG